MSLKINFLLIILALVTNFASAADTLIVGSTNGNAGSSSVPLIVSATHDQPIQGFSISIDYDESALTLDGFDFLGTATETVAPGGVPDYVGSILDSAAGTLVLGVVIGFNPTSPGGSIPQIAVSSIDADDLLRLLFTIGDSVTPGDYEVNLVDGLGNPPVINAYSFAGATVHPELQDGTMTVNNLHRFYFGTYYASPGGAVTPLLRYDHVDEIDGFVASVIYDNAILTLNPPSETFGWYSGLNTDFGLSPDTIEFFLVNLNPVVAPGIGWASFAAQFDFLPPFNGQTLGAGNGQSLLRFPFSVVNDPTLLGTTTIVELSNDYGPPGSPPTANLVVVPPGLGIFPIREDCEIQFLDLPSFKRGNVNGDLVLNLADAVFVINWLFASGPAPQCLDAGDANDDSGTDISDAIYMINYLFASGPALPPPFPDCGLDPTDDSLDCTFSAGC